MTQTPKRALIIGAGPGGLASAMLLAHAGVEVDVFESKPHVGGRTSSFTLDGGYQFDLGPTFFLYTRVLEELYRTVGRELRDEVELRRVDPQYRLTFGPGEEWDAAHIDASGDLERMSAEIARLSEAIKALEHLQALARGESRGRPLSARLAAEAPRRLPLFLAVLML